MTVETVVNQENKILCFCNCGELIDKFDKQGRERFYKNHHGNKGKHFPQLSGKNNPSWKGDNASYEAIHMWIRKHLAKPESGLCPNCNVKQVCDVACITGIYNRDFYNWKWLCRSCHFKYDYSSGLKQVSEQTRLKISNAMKGTRFSYEHRQHISESKKGANNPNYGKSPWNKGKSIIEMGAVRRDKKTGRFISNS